MTARTAIARTITTLHLCATALLLLCATALLPLAFGRAAMAGGGVTVERFAHAERVEIMLGRSAVVRTPGPVSRISLGAPDIADILLLSPTQMHLTGKTLGSTNLVMWDKADRVVAVYDVIVAPNLTHLKELIHQVLPGESDIRVFAAQGKVSLAGTATSPENMSRALALAESFSPGKVLNLMQVGGVRQVMLEVKVAEVSRSVLKRMGVNFSYFMNGDFVYQFLNNMVYLDNQNGPLPISPYESAGNMYVTQSVNGMFRFHNGNAVYTGFLDALKQNGLIKILAEPTLICLSGQGARFLAGGEIPIPIPGALGTVTIEYKPYGVGLEFMPTVLGRDRISMKVTPEVSELDYNNAVNVNNFLIPALNTRKAATTVELADGQSFAIAGLLNDSVREVVDKTPGLGDLPVLGTLFRSNSFQKSETELVILVTPRLVRPVDMAQHTLPTDNWDEPNDVDFYLHGKRSEPRPDKAALTQPAAAPAREPESGMEGAFGHSLPQTW
ncbi:MAG: type II and III secretion system protein family protein [Desulfovibrionaceae bacterium]